MRGNNRTSIKTERLEDLLGVGTLYYERFDARIKLLVKSTYRVMCTVSRGRLHPFERYPDKMA
tara:strand:- start:180 stop:368 length:189 start_codon:yes stop_codon:yes gene_type:complete